MHALTTPLVTDSEGQKFGKSTGGGSLWLDPEMTSPYAWYQYFVNTADADVIRYLRWFTFLTADELAELEQVTTERPHERAAQRRLARELTNLVHGEAATASVEHASQALFGRGELSQLDEPTLAAALREASVAELGRGRRRRDHRPAGGHRPIGQQGRGEAHDRRGRGVRQQRPHRERGVVAAALGLPARSLAGVAPRQEEHRRRRTRWMSCRSLTAPAGVGCPGTNSAAATLNPYVGADALCVRTIGRESKNTPYQPI